MTMQPEGSKHSYHNILPFEIDRAARQTGLVNTETKTISGSRRSLLVRHIGLLLVL